MTTKMHPSESELTEYIISPQPVVHSEITEHIEYCVICQEKIKQMRGTITALKKGVQYSTTDVISYKHVSEDQLVKYVYDELKQEEKDRIERHFEECYLCFKTSLRLKAHIEERKIKEYVTQPENVEPLFKNDRESEFDIPSKSIKLSTANTMTIAAAISLLCITFLLNSYSDFEWGGNSQDIIAKQSNDLLPSNTISHINVKTSKIDNEILSQGTGYQRVDNGRLNWYEGFIETTAVGTVDVRKMANPVQAEIVAEKTARHLAYAQLSEILGGVFVSQHSTYNDYLANDNYLSVKNSQFIQGATIINKKIEWIDASPKVSVTMQLPLYGSEGARSLIQPQKNTLDQNTGLIDSKVNINNANSITGIVLDVRGFDYTPALFASLQSNNKIIDQLDAAYIPTTKNLDNIGVIGKNPHIIKAMTSAEPGQVMVNSLDSEFIKEYIQSGKTNFAIMF